MNSKALAADAPVVAAPDPFWVTSQYATGELDGKLVRIEWVRQGEVLDWGIYRIEMGACGHSRHIQSIHAVLVETETCEIAEFDFDQTDADHLHRSNERPKRYGLVARLDQDRPREQNLHLEKLVRERRQRKVKDTQGMDPWEPVLAPVLKPALIADGGGLLSEDSDGPAFPRS